MFRMMGAFDLPGTGVAIGANFQYFSGKPWAATTLVSPLPQGDQRVLIEPRGSRRLSSQSLLDLRVSRGFEVAAGARIDLALDLLNTLNNTAEEALASDNLFSPTFGLPTVFVDPRRAMISVKVSFGG
jgi:hypothetical protein